MMPHLMPHLPLLAGCLLLLPLLVAPAAARSRLLDDAAPPALPPAPSAYLAPAQLSAFAAALRAAAPHLVSAAREIGRSVEGQPIEAFCVGLTCPGLDGGAASPPIMWPYLPEF